MYAICHRQQNVYSYGFLIPSLSVFFFPRQPNLPIRNLAFSLGLSPACLTSGVDGVVPRRQHFCTGIDSIRHLPVRRSAVELYVLFVGREHTTRDHLHRWHNPSHIYPRFTVLRLVVTLVRDESIWRAASSGKETQLTGTPFITAISSWQSGSLLRAKPIIHWLFGGALIHRSFTYYSPELIVLFRIEIEIIPFGAGTTCYSTKRASRLA